MALDQGNIDLRESSKSTNRNQAKKLLTTGLRPSGASSEPVWDAGEG